MQTQGGRSAGPKRTQRRPKMARGSGGGRAACIYLWLAGGACVIEGWRGGRAEAALAGLVPIALAVAVTAGSLPLRVTEAPRRSISEQTVAAAGWTWRRVLGGALAALAILFSPMTCAIGGSRGSGEEWMVWLGTLMFLGGIVGVILTRRRPVESWDALRRLRKSRAQRADAEWTWDHRWDDAGSRKSFRVYLRTRWMYLGRTCIVVGGLLLPVPNDGTEAWAIVAVLRIALGVTGAVWLLRAWWILGMGHVALGYLKFPVHPGERASFTLGVSEGGAAILDAEVVLRHFKESRGGWGPGSGLPLATAEITALEPPPPAEFAPGVHRRVEFDVPADAPGTAISSANPSYWAVEIRGRTRAGPYEERFLVPVYEKPAEVAALPVTPA